MWIQLLVYEVLSTLLQIIAGNMGIDWCFNWKELHVLLNIWTCSKCILFALLVAYIFKLWVVRKLLSSRGRQSILYLFCIQAELMLQGTMYLSLDVGSRAPLGLAWGLSSREQDRESLVTVLVAYSRGWRRTVIWGCNTTFTNVFNFSLVGM